MTRHKLRADSAVGKVEDGVGEIGQLFGDSESVAAPSTSRSTMRSSWRRRKRAKSTAEGTPAPRNLIQALAIVLAR